MQRKPFLYFLAASALVAGTVFAQGSADNPRVIDDDPWRTESWEGCYMPDDFIWVMPHVAYVGSNLLEVVWLTRGYGSGWVDWSQDGWATTNRAWTAKYGVRDYCELLHKIDVTGFDPALPLAWRAVSMKVVQSATGFTQYEGEPYYEWTERGAWSALARKRQTYESGAVLYTAEGVANPLIPAKGKASFVVLNDTHHGLGLYTNLVRHAGENVALAILNGDIMDHSRSQEDIVKYVNGPLAYLGRELHCATRYVRGNHEISHAWASRLADHMGLQEGQLYGAVDFGPARIAFLDTASGHGKDTDINGYLAQEMKWLEREVASDEWKRAKYRLVVGHIPPCTWNGRNHRFVELNMPCLPLFKFLNGKGVTAMIGAHCHFAFRLPPNDVVDYPVLAGGAPSIKGSTIMRCDMDDESIRIRIFDYQGVTIHEWRFPDSPCKAMTPAPLAADPKHYWWDAHRYRINQVKTAPRAPDFILLGDSIFHYWDNKENQPSWQKLFSGEGGAPYYGLNLAIEGDRTESLLWRLQNGLLSTNDAPPKVAFVLIGTNNTANRKIEDEPPDDTAAGVAAIVEQVKAATQGRTKIVVYGLLPRGKGASDPLSVRNRYANRSIWMLADGKTVFYRDIGGKFLNKDGTVNRELLPDALHAGAKGFDVIAEDILATLKTLKIPPAGGTDRR